MFLSAPKQGMWRLEEQDSCPGRRQSTEEKEAAEGKLGGMVAEQEGYMMCCSAEDHPLQEPDVTPDLG